MECNSERQVRALEPAAEAPCAMASLYRRCCVVGCDSRRCTTATTAFATFAAVVFIASLVIAVVVGVLVLDMKIPYVTH